MLECILACAATAHVIETSCGIVQGSVPAFWWGWPILPLFSMSAPDADKNPYRWKEPFLIDITGALTSNTDNHIVMRVEDKLGMGGIWKPRGHPG